MKTLSQDVRYGLRVLAKNPGLTIIVVVILTVGIGINTAVFSLVNSVILQALPYAEADRLVTLMERRNKIDAVTVHDRFLRWREQSQVFEHMAAYSGRRPYVAGIERPRYVWAVAVSPDVFPLLGVQPLLGRGFLPEEEQPGKERVVVLSHRFWREDLGGSPTALGATVTIDGKACTIVGVMPPDFSFPIGDVRAFWMPLVYQRTRDWPSGGLVLGVARLKRECTLDQARAAMAVIENRLKQTDPEADAISVQRLLDRQLGASGQLLWLVLGAAGGVLLITCTNVASLLLARATVQQREMAIRVALGASRSRIVRQMLTESLLLSLGGGLLGLLVTFLTIKGLVHLCPANVPRLTETHVDGAVLAFTLGVALLTGLFFGAMPACRASDISVSRILKEGQTRSSTGRGWRGIHSSLVIVQTGLSLILLVGAVLLIRTWIALQGVDLGFQPEKVLFMKIRLLESRYPVYDRCEAFFEPLLRQVRALPHVRAAALTPSLSFGVDEIGSPITIAGRPPANSGEGLLVKSRGVTPGFFETLGIRLVRGRTFVEGDLQGKPSSAIIDESLARQYFAKVDPIDQKVRLEGVDYTVVGVVSTPRDFRHLHPVLGVLFYPRDRYWRDMVCLIRTEEDPLRLIGAIRAQVAQLDTDQVITEIGTLDAYLSAMLAPQRFGIVLLGPFAGIALALTMVGIYGLVQYSTAQQTHDIGVRLALGARKADVLKAVLGHGLRLALLGVVLGLTGAWALTRFLSHLLYGVIPTDRLTFACVSLILVAVALLASYLPARRAAKVDPMAALRYE